MERHVLDEPLADDPDPASVVQGVTVLAAGSHRLAPCSSVVCPRISYLKTARRWEGSGLTVPRAPGYCAAIHNFSRGENP